VAGRGKKLDRGDVGEADRVTKGEAAVVTASPICARSGAHRQALWPGKAGQIERFLMLQARLGILRKTLEKLQDERCSGPSKSQMNDLRNEMDDARRS